MKSVAQMISMLFGGNPPDSQLKTAVQKLLDALTESNADITSAANKLSTAANDCISFYESQQANSECWRESIVKLNMLHILSELRDFFDRLPIRDKQIAQMMLVNICSLIDSVRFSVEICEFEKENEERVRGNLGKAGQLRQPNSQ